MPINQTSNDQLQTELISRYNLQRKRNQQLQQAQRQIQQRGNESTERNNPSSEDVRVTLTRTDRSRNTGRGIEISRMETEPRSREVRNIESNRAAQVYQNVNKITENARTENTRQRQINRIIG